MKKAEREIYLKNRLKEMKNYENQLYSQGFKYIAGVDEVGRGPLAGPVVAAAVVLPESFDLLGVDDSKKLSEKKREKLYGEILDRAVCWGIGHRDCDIIDEINILQATKSAMSDAIEAAEKMLKENAGDGESIDFILFDAMEIKEVSKAQKSLIKGDSKSVSIAAASIIAKVTRDRQMIKYHEEYPHYGFDSNKGYGTRAHYEGLKSHGMTPIHRRSFLKNFNER